MVDRVLLITTAGTREHDVARVALRDTGLDVVELDDRLPSEAGLRSLAARAGGLVVVNGPGPVDIDDQVLIDQVTSLLPPDVPMAVLVGEDGAGDVFLAEDGISIATYESLADLVLATHRAAHHLELLEAHRARSAPDLALHPPAERPDPDDAGMVVAEMEVLLVWAERVVADEARPGDLRDEVDARRRQLRDELRLIEQGRGSSAVLTGLAGALLALVRPGRAEEGLGAAVDRVADAAVALGGATADEDRVAAGDEVVAALDQVGEEVARIVEVSDRDDLKVAAYRTAGAFLQEDLRPHLDALLVALRERVLPAGGGVAAGTAVQQLMGGPPWLAVTIVAAGLLRSLFPWIFPRREPPER